uniref:Uncharacterized protein n=1 Tax=Meleagris gallopavo TaxID=9103 RepID=A0A803XTF8_MELGA
TWTRCAPPPMTSSRSSLCWASRRCARLWSGSCTTSSPLTVPTSTTVTWPCCATP